MTIAAGSAALAADPLVTMTSAGALRDHAHAGVAGDGGALKTVATDTIWDAAGDLVYGTGADTAARLAKGTQSQTLRMNTGATAPTWGSGGTVQTVNTQTGAAATGTTTLPMDDTIPQNTEGDQYMTLAITPINASNILHIDVVACFAHSAATHVTCALFQDTTANALASSVVKVAAVDNLIQIVVSHTMTAGTTSATTFKVRLGGDGAGTVTFNGRNGSRIDGGVIASSITIREIAA